MPAYYWIELYVDNRDMSTLELVHRSVGAVAGSGGSFRKARFPIVIGDSTQLATRSYRFEDRGLKPEEAENLVAADLDRRQQDPGRFAELPIQLYFLFEFEFDGDVWAKVLENEKISDKDAVKEVHLSFWPRSDPEYGKSIMVSLHTYEEFVLMYGTDETHRRNKLKILEIVERTYNEVKPYFGWMDGETSSNDQSYQALLDRKLPFDDESKGNEFVIVGPRMIGYLDVEKLKTSNYAWKRLLDGGIVIQNYLRYNDLEQRII